jgi:hypothetical protein
MTVLTLPAQPGQATGSGPLPWRRMLWVTWRQHRAMLIGLTSVLAAAAVFLLIAGLKVRQDYAGLAHCDFATVTYPSACATKISHFNNNDWTLGNTCLIFMNLAPALIGAFTGPAVFARELENGTFRYAWTQGIGRVRWAIAKLVLLGTVLAVLAWAFSQLYSWFFNPFLTTEDMNVLAASVFDTRGIDFAAWVLVAFMIGAFLGMLIRKIIPAMAATLGGYLGVMLLAWLVLREDYPVAIDTTNGKLVNGGPAGPGSPWILKSWTVGRTQWWRYIPVSRFWPMQFIESGWLLVLAIALGAATLWLVRRRAA